jgi:ABC-type Fe3+/spermidine/putrescine transport system ATPase subunit
MAAMARGASVGIRLEGLGKRFAHHSRGDVDAVRDVSLAVSAGKFLTLLGPSGCGKTTTLRMIAGFEAPTRGRVFFGESDVTGLPANRRNIGFVFQNYALFPHLAVAENVAYGLRVRRWAAADIERAVTDVLVLVGLAGYERRFPHQLSGGEQQRVALARAVVIQPQVLLFDEPLSNLDARLRVQMRDEIRRLQARLAITTVYVTHDQEEAMAIADEIAVMDRGRLVQLGSAEDLYARPASAFVAHFIGRVSVLRAKLVGAAEGGALVDVNGQRIAADGTPRAAADGTVAVAVRPETIELTAATSDHDSAVVQSRVFLGDKVDYVVDWSGVRVLVCAWDPVRRETMRVGDRVEMRLPTRGARLLPDDEPR